MSILNEITDPGIAPITAAVITAAVGLNTMFFRWLVSSFRALSKDIQGLAALSRKQLDDHEDKDQYRHEENLRRFEIIAVALARVDANQVRMTNV